MFEKELKVFNDNIDKLKATHPSGGFVVIKDTEILGVWTAREDALKEGYKTYGNVSFLVKDINLSNMSANFSRPITFA